MDLLYKRDKTEDDVDKLVRIHKNLVYYCLSELNQINNQDAESAAFEALWDAINLFDVYATTAFSTYACKVIKNRILSVIKKQKKHRENEILAESSTSFFNDSYELGAEEEYTKQDKRYNKLCRQIDGYINNQTDKGKAILLYWRSKCYNATTIDIAAHCGVSSSYVSRVQVSFKVAVQAMIKSNNKFDKD